MGLRAPADVQPTELRTWFGRRCSRPAAGAAGSGPAWRGGELGDGGQAAGLGQTGQVGCAPRSPQSCRFAIPPSALSRWCAGGRRLEWAVRAGEQIRKTVSVTNQSGEPIVYLFKTSRPGRYYLKVTRRRRPSMPQGQGKGAEG